MEYIQRKIQQFALLLAIATLTTIVACDNGTDCNINNIAYNRIQLYDASYRQDTVPGNYIYPDTLTVKLLINNKDSIIINKLVGASELQLPVSYTHECDTLVFAYSGNITDTLYMEHTNIPYFISTDCGMAMSHRLTGLRHTNNLIDSAEIKEPIINFDWNENIKLYIIE